SRADQFDTHNHFYGGQLAARVDYRWRNFSVDLTGKVALGSVHETVDIAGSTQLAAPAFFPVASQSLPGGFFASATNSGRHTRDPFCVVPEGEVTVGYLVRSWALLFVGYNFLYLSGVVRPADQIAHGITLPRLALNQALAPGLVLEPPAGPER